MVERELEGAGGARAGSAGAAAVFERVWGEVSGAAPVAAGPKFQGSPAAYVRCSRAALEAAAALVAGDPKLCEAVAAQLWPGERARGPDSAGRTCRAAAVWAHWKLSGALAVLKVQGGPAGRGGEGRAAVPATLLAPGEALALGSAVLGTSAPVALDFIGDAGAEGLQGPESPLAAHAAEMVRRSLEAARAGGWGRRPATPEERREEGASSSGRAAAPPSWRPQPCLKPGAGWTRPTAPAPGSLAGSRGLLPEGRGGARSLGGAARGSGSWPSAWRSWS